MKQAKKWMLLIIQNYQNKFMAHQVQLIFDKVTDLKTQAKEIKAIIKYALLGTQEYVDLTEKTKQLRERKKQIEQSVKSDLSTQVSKLEDLKIDIESEETMLSDAVVSKIMKGETVEVKDAFGNEYEVEFKVKFKKS